MKNKFLLGLIVVIYFLIYIPTYKTPFIMDDSHTVQSNQFIHSLKYLTLPWTTAKAYSSSPENYGYRPITANFSQIFWFLGDGSPVPFQIAKKILLLLTAWLFFLTWTKWHTIFNNHNIKNNLWWGTGYFAFSFCLLHPVATQVANYIAASSTLLCSMFYMLGLYLYLCFKSENKKTFLALAALSYFLAAMAKEEGITLMAIIFIIEAFYFRSFAKKQIKAHLPFIVFLCVAFLSTYLIFSHFEPSSNIARGSVPRSLYFATQWRAYFHYIGLYFWPFNFNFDFLAFSFATELWNWTNAFYLFLNICLLVIGLRLCYQQKIWGLAILGFYISILPASSIIPLAEPVNDHRDFIPFLFFGFGLTTALTHFAHKTFKNSKYKNAFFMLLLVYLGSATLYRNFDFTSNKTLWTDTVLKNPTSGRAKNNLALEYMKDADYEFASQLLLSCLKDNTQYSSCHINMAVIRSAQGNDSEAELYFKSGIQYDFGRISSRLFYSDFLIRKKRFIEAREILTEADSFSSGLNKPVTDRLQTVNAQLGTSL